MGFHLDNHFGRDLAKDGNPIDTAPAESRRSGAGNLAARICRWVAMLAGQYSSADGKIVRDAQARLSDMIQTQPTAHELKRIAVPVTLMIGTADRTAFRAASAPESLRRRIRTVPQAAELAVRSIPKARLIRFPGLGHSPQVEAPANFNAQLVEALATQRN